MKAKNKRVTLQDSVNFHGHLGPYLVLGLLAGALALKELDCKKHFGLHVKVWGAKDKPKSCLIDGLQLSTGATYGKGNIEKLHGQSIEIEVAERESGKKIFLTLKNELAKELGRLTGHKDSEKLAAKLYRTERAKIFDWRTTE